MHFLSASRGSLAHKVGAKSQLEGLDNKNRHIGGEVKCDLCSAELEDLHHFILWCPGYLEERRKEPRLQQPYEEDEDKIIGNVLFAQENWEGPKEVIYRMWKAREKKRKQIN